MTRVGGSLLVVTISLYLNMLARSLEVKSLPLLFVVESKYCGVGLAWGVHLLLVDTLGRFLTSGPFFQMSTNFFSSAGLHI